MMALSLRPFGIALTGLSFGQGQFLSFENINVMLSYPLRPVGSNSFNQLSPSCEI
jgi:hypothetical protein